MQAVGSEATCCEPRWDCSEYTSAINTDAMQYLLQHGDAQLCNQLLSKYIDQVARLLCTSNLIMHCVFFSVTKPHAPVHHYITIIH